MYSKNLLSDYNNKVFSVSKSKESSPISPERHTSFNLINRSSKQLLPLIINILKVNKEETKRSIQGSGSPIPPHFTQMERVIASHVKKYSV